MKKIKSTLICALCVAMICMSLFANVSAAPTIVKSGDTSQIHWELDSNGTLTINLLSGISDWTAGFPTDNKKTINGTEMYAACPWGEYTHSADGRVLTADYSAVRKIVIGEGIKTIPNYAFVSNFYDTPNAELKKQGYYHTNVTELVLPSTLTKIGMHTFTNMQFTEIHLEDYALTDIGNSAFENVPLTGRVVLPSSLSTLGSSVFRTYQTSVTHPSAKLTEFVIPADSKLTSIPVGTFDGQANLKLAIMPDSITSLGSYSFRGCPNLSIIFTGATTPQFNGTASEAPFAGSKGAKIYYIKGTSGWANVSTDDLGTSTVNADDIIPIDEFAKDYTDYGAANSNILWLYGSGKLTLVGGGTFGSDFTSQTVPWNAHLLQIGLIELDSNITDITAEIGSSSSECLLSAMDKTDDFAMVKYSNFTNSDASCLFAAVGYDETGKAVSFSGSMQRSIPKNTSGLLVAHFPSDSTVKRSKAFLWKNISGESMRPSTEKDLYVD